MGRFYRNLVIIITILVLFIISFFSLFFYLKNKIIHTPISTFQFYQLVIMCLSAFFTLSAVMVALFKEQLYALLKYAKLDISPRDENFLFENMEEQSSEGGSSTPIAQSYETFLLIQNNGNKLAEGCTMQITSLHFMSDDHTEQQEIDVSKCVPLCWNGNTIQETPIHPKSRAIISVIKISADPVKGMPSNPSEGDQSIPTTLAIAGIKVNSADLSKGKWTAVFTLCSKNSQLRRYKLEIEWKGKWKPRLKEFKPFISIKEVKN